MGQVCEYAVRLLMLNMEPRGHPKGSPGTQNYPKEVLLRPAREPTDVQGGSRRSSKEAREAEGDPQRSPRLPPEVKLRFCTNFTAFCCWSPPISENQRTNLQHYRCFHFRRIPQKFLEIFDVLPEFASVVS